MGFDPDQHTDDTTAASTASATNNSGTPRKVGRRDWIAVAAVVAVVLALGVYLLVRPTDQPATADGSSPPPAPAASASTIPSAASSNPGGGVMPPTSAEPTGPTSTNPTGSTSANPAGSTSANPAGRPSAGPTSPPAASVQDTGAQKAPKIGPLGDLARRQANDPMARGDVDAPVVMVMFSDYRCPFCAQFSRTTEPQLVDKYVTSGVLRIEWRDMPIFGEQSTAAAIAGRAAAAQGKFFEFTQAVYADAPQKGHADLTSQALIDFAKKAGVPDLDAFTAAMDDSAAAKAVAADLDESSSIGVPSTPAFIINGYPLLGAQPLTEFTTLIDTVQTLS